MLYAKSTGGFYSADIHGDNIPSDVVEITAAEHAALLQGQSEGMIIAADADGKPYLQDAPDTTPEEIAAAVTAARQAAYAKESDPIFFLSQRGEATQADWLAKIAEIKARYPDGVMP